MTRTMLELPMSKTPHISMLEPAGSSDFSNLESFKEPVSTTTLMASSPQQFSNEYSIPVLWVISQLGISFAACWRSSSRDSAMRVCASAMLDADSAALAAASFAPFSCFDVRTIPMVVVSTAITALIALIHAGASILASPSVGCGETSTVADRRGEGGGLSGSSSPSSCGGDRHE